MDQSLLEQKLALEDSMQTSYNLKLLKSEDAEKLLQMDKQDIIAYYEGLLDKCNQVILKKRDQVKQARESKLNL